MLNRILLIMLAGILSTSLQAQTSTITGKVSAGDGSPLAGVTVHVKNSNRNTTTKNDGTYIIQAGSGDVLQFSMVGRESTELTVVATSGNDARLNEGRSNLDEIVLVGSRRAGRIKMETAVPVDVVNIAQVSLPTARMDLTSILNYVAPSFNFNKQSGSDGADHVDLATLRGLGPDQTLVLVNGKRRHQTAFVSVFGTRGRGASGTDLGAIPISAIDRVEILRDGAAAQYGSDAIAGVINILLKKNVNMLTGDAGVSAYYDKEYNTAFKDLGQYYTGDKLDGKSYSANLNYGLGLGNKGGFLNLSGGLLHSGKTFRQALDTVLSHEDGLPINPVRRAFGDGSLLSVATMYNLELPASGNAVFYSFGGYTHKSSEAYAYTRNFSARPDRFPTDASDNLIFVPSIMRRTTDGDVYYNPVIETKISDISMAAGIKGMINGWNWDLSNASGQNKFHFYGDQTFNASIGAAKTHFDDGGFSFFQNTTNLNFDKELRNIGEGFHLALGAEFRAENYKIFAGEKDSYTNYSTGDKATGSQGFPGYQPSDVINARRSAVGAYADAEIDVTKRWLVAGAVRVENYSDFGFTDNYKLSTRIKATDNFNIRSSISTGFRAPSLQQINFSSTFTTVQGGTVAEVKIAPNYSPITKAAGIPELKQERSVNLSVGFTYKPIPAASLTMDLYRVKIKDRVVLSGQFDASDPSLDSALTTSLQNLNVGLAQFFANAVNTTNTGVDIVFEYNKKLNANHTIKGLLTANFNDMEFDRINTPEKLNDTKQHRQTFLSDREKAFILAGAPKSKIGANLEVACKRLTVGTRFTYFGRQTLLGYGEDGLGIDPMVPTDADDQVYVKDEYKLSPKWVTDLYASFQASKKIAVHFGADNLFNVHPDMSVVKSAKYWAYNNETGGAWDAVQMGANGLRLFARLSFKL